MRPAILQLDDSLSRQPGLEQGVRERGGRTLLAGDLGPALRLWTRAATLETLADRLRASLPAGNHPDVVFAGSGDFHHVTPLLIARAIARFGGPVTVLHFDNHPDWVRHAPGRHCGSWVGRAARLEGVARVITIGVCSPDIGAKRARQGDLSLIGEDRLDLYAWADPDGGEAVQLGGRTWPTICALGEPAFLDVLDAAIATARVYVTIDKDVLRAADAVTNWDQGQASLGFVMAAVTRAAQSRRVIGADVVGDWSAPIYGGDLAARMLKRGEALLDQPWAKPSPIGVLAVNEAVNLELLTMFAEIGR
jgi:arginase family enzyme